MFSGAVLIYVIIGVIVVGTTSRNFIMRGFCIVIMTTATYLSLVVYGGYQVALKVTEPSVLHGRVAPVPLPPLGRAEPGEGRLVDLAR